MLKNMNSSEVLCLTGDLQFERVAIKTEGERTPETVKYQLFVALKGSYSEMTSTTVGNHVIGMILFTEFQPGRVAQSVGHLTRKSGVLGSIPGLATYFRFSFRFSKKGSCQLLAKVCARSTG